MGDGLLEIGKELLFMKKLLFWFFTLAATAVLAAPFRGVVEGYYGRAWGNEGRMELIKFMGERGLDTFIYGPKNDPYHRDRWREAYPKSEMEGFASLLQCAKTNRVRLYWAIHLGGVFEGRSGDELAQDFKDLFNKLESMYQGGFRAFAVFFDDFGSTDAALHSEIGNRIIRDFLDKKGDCEPLIICPNVYSVIGDPYQKTMGEKLDQKAMIMWTGDGVCTDIKAEDVARITADLRRAPFIWWNWPVSDYCRKRLLLGRMYGLENAPVAGIVLNPMENLELSKIAIFSFAEWCRNPDGFDSSKIWRNSFDQLYADPEVAAAMRVFSEHNSDPGENFAGFRREESVSAVSLIAEADAELAAGGLRPLTEKRLRKLFGEIRDAAELLLRKLPRQQPKLAWEAEGWLEDERLLMEMAFKALELLNANGKREDRVVNELNRLVAERLAAGEVHMEKFRAATFPEDRNLVIGPEASGGVIGPLVERMIISRLAARIERKTGRSCDRLSTLRAESTAKAFSHPVVERKGKEAGLKPMLETCVFAPGEGFEICLPLGAIASYFHARFEDREALTAGVVEISTDGREWTAVKADAGGLNAQCDLAMAKKYSHARFRNLSDHPVRVKAKLFKFDVTGSSSILEQFLKEAR